MRLQVSLQRHTLPAVNIVFATGTGPASHTISKSATIFNLLEDLNDLVPLESSDTEWGLEDYVVEVAATADQESAYECLHYLPIASVLREDDEVVVRPLLSNDLRAWRRGGRLQITEDGTHLIDGVVFSRQWTRTGRPEFAIPPRKRRRLLEDEVNSVKENLEPLAAPLPALMAPGYDQEDEEDEDYVTDEELDEHAVTINGTFDDADEYDDDEQGDVDGDELQLLLKDAAELENAQNADGLLEVQLKARTNLGKRKRQPGDDADVQESQETVFEGFTSPARSRVLQDVSEKFNGLDDPHSESDADSLLDEVAVKESNKQKANQAEGDDNESSDDEDYAAKSSPSSSASSESDDEVVPPKPLAKGEIKQKKQSQESYVEASGDESSASADSSSSSDRSSEESSSSSESESESDSDLSSDNESSDDEQIPNKPPISKTPQNSASDKQTPNLPKLTPPGQGSRKTHLNNKRVKQRKHLNALKAQGVLPQHATFADLAEYKGSPKAGSSALNDDETDLEAARQKVLSQILGETVHDGSSDVVAKSIEAQEGLGEASSLAVPETQYVDRREDQPESVPLPELSPESKLRLLDLKEPDRARHWVRCCFEQSPENSMSQDAIFVAYYRCFSEHGPLPGSEFLPCILKEFSRAIVEDPFDPYTNIKGIRARGTISEMGIGPAVPAAAGDTLRPHPTARRPSDAATQDLTQTKTNPSTPREEPATNTDEPSPKRAKLDVSASRRLIFGALGSRNPKTAAQEKAVRDKLSAPARNVAVKPQSQIGESPKQDQGTAVSTRQSWKKKLVITAVECEKDAVTYPPPPFPFVQHWHKTDKGRWQASGLDRPSSSSSSASFPSNRGTPKVATPAPVTAASQESNVESRTVSFEKDARDGMPIPSDYTALANLGKSQCTTGAIIAFKQLEVDMKTFMPQVSDYKVARVIQFHGEKAEIILATRFRMQPPALDGEDDDQDKMSSFVIREAGDADDGVRELAYSELIEAKLIELSGIQVPASTSGNSELQHGSDGKGPEPQEDTAAVSESVLAPVKRPTPPALDSQMEIATPRRAEISVLIKDAGFNSELPQPKLDSDLAAHPEATDSAQNGQGTQQSENSLLPSQSGIVVANTSALLTENRSSSPFFPLDEEVSEDRDSAQDDTQLSSQIPPVSSSPMRLQTTVEYPEIQMSLGSDLPEQTFSRNSSSHQDAQRLSPPPGNDTTLVASEQREPIEPIIEGSRPQAQPDAESDADMDENSELEEAPKTKNSMLNRLGLSLDGADSSYELSDDDSESEDEVPSLRGLTSSQKRKIMTRASGAKRSSQISKKVSPRPLKRMTARSSGRTKKTPDVKDDDSDSDIANLPAIKISASQREARVPRLSQIPKGTQVVDLTLSSGPGNSDGEFELHSGKQRVTRNGTGSQSRANKRAAAVGNRGGDLGIAFLAFLSVRVSFSTTFALAEQSQADPQQILNDYLDQEEARREQFRASGGNDAVHQTWARLRELEPFYKETYISLVPTDFIGTAWYYTKWVLKVLFMNAPPSQPVDEDGGYRLQPALQQAIEDLEEATTFADDDAMYLLGEMSMHGNFSHPRDPQSAFYWYSKLAELTGNDTAQYMVGLLHATGIGGVERNQAKALLYHDFAAGQGNVRSEMTLAFRYHMGIGTPRDCDKAVGFYQRVADKAMDHWRSGPPGGLLLSRNSYRWVEATGGAYGEGASASSSGPNTPASGGFQGNVEDILEYLSLRESSGDLGATYQLGKHYYDPPRGYRRNLRAAQRQFNKIARLYWGKDGKVNPRVPEGIDKVAGKAAAYLGRMFLRGEGMEQNFDKAINFFKLGISNGDPFAQYHLGLMYRDGIGVTQDGGRAGTLLKSAAEQGSALAQSALGVMFLDQGDIDTAGRYFELAASAGVMEAFYYLAELTNLGVGRERNCGLAAVYYKVVAERAEGLHSSFLEANNAFERGDYERAFVPMLMAAEQGYEHAQANVAHLLDQHTSYLSIGSIPFLSQRAPSVGSRLLNNLELALVYFTRSARQANVDSLVKMGDYYLSGLVPSTATDAPDSIPTPSMIASPKPDVEKATTCYTSAAENHHSAQALWNLGWLHENGIGPVKQDFHMAKRYYDLAYEMNKDAAYLPVKLALMKLRLRSWWNGVSGGKVNPIRDDDEEGANKKPKTFWEWLNRFLDNFEEMDAQEAARQAAQQGQEGDMDWLAAEPGMPGGDAEYAAGGRADRVGGNGAGYDGAGDDWEDFDDGLVESLIIIALAGALALLVYARQQQQQQQQGRNNNGNPGGLAQQQPQQQGAVGGIQPAGAAGAQQAPQQPPPPEQPQREDRGVFPQPGDPDLNNWVAGGVGH